MKTQMRALRRATGVTLEQLAAKIPAPPNELKVSKATLSKFELGQRRLTPEWAEVIAVALGVDAADLLPEARAEESPRLEATE